MALASRAYNWASASVAFNWRTSTCAWVQANSSARSARWRSWYLLIRFMQALRLSPTPCTRSTTAVSSGSSVIVQRMADTGSSTEPWLPDSGTRESIASGSATDRPRPRNRDRSVSYDARPGSPPWIASSWNIHGGLSSGLRPRRVLRMARSDGTISVWMNRLLKAGCSSSAMAGAMTTSA
ncbi:hypothetical protein D3C71_1115290 [compost metagenome]